MAKSARLTNFVMLLATVSPTALAGLRDQQPPPDQALKLAVQRYRAADPAAKFGYFAGQVDRFSTKPKSTVPGYALPVLQQNGLPTTPALQAILPTRIGPKLGRDLDDDLTRKLPVPYELATNDPEGTAAPGDPTDTDGSTQGIRRENRTLPPLDPTNRPAWTHPSADTLAREKRAAKAILARFLAANSAVFRVPKDQTDQNLPSLVPIDLMSGRLGRIATFEQSYGADPVLNGRLAVLFDANWNVVAISRMVITPAKLSVDVTATIGHDQALALARGEAARRSGTAASAWVERSAQLGVDPIRRHKLWKIRLVIPGDGMHNVKVKVDARNGAVLVVSNNVEEFTDAEVRRWSFENGYLNLPSQVVATNFYTRDDNTLVHDFFYMMNDDRFGGDPQGTCTDTTRDTPWTEAAYDTHTGSSYVRATRRPDRIFSGWTPHATAGSFAETNSYYWARWYMQWQKTALDELGLLESSAADFEQVLILQNSCYTAPGVYFDDPSDFEVTTLDNAAETLPLIVLRERCKSTNANCELSTYDDPHPDAFQVCEDEGCAPSPGTLHHELNHFVMHRYLDVDYEIDCANEVELAYLHEGTLGTALPQAYWHHYYGVGYEPDDEQLYKKDMTAGRVHTDSTDRSTISGFPCSDTADKYEAGRVAGQPLWEIFHGTKVIGSTSTAMEAPASDTEFLDVVYAAAFLTPYSTLEDRTQFAEWVMIFADISTSISATGKSDWCAVFADHGMTAIDPAYCN